MSQPLQNSIPRILVVDDEVDLRELVEITLVRMGMSVDTAGTVAQAQRYLEENRYQLVLTDMRLTDGEGFEVLMHSLTHQPTTPVAVITAYGSADQAVHALKIGAFDYLTKPLEVERLRALVRAALGDGAKSKTRADGASNGLIGESAAIEAVRIMISRLANSMAPVLIHGESGSGKERAARLIHLQSSRAHQPFIAVNCGAIPETLMESEFFGYRKGAFTGAEQDRNGFFQAAHGGTLLLDEVAELPLSMQVKLLRVIQERQVRKVGATQEEPVDVRILSATHRSLIDGVARGTFRQDLYYRLNVIELTMPALRERSDDIPALAQAVLHKHAPGDPTLALSSRFHLTPAALQLLRLYPYPGNVRELENILERALALATGPALDVSLLNLPSTLNHRASSSLQTPSLQTPSLQTPFVAPLDLPLTTSDIPAATASVALTTDDLLLDLPTASLEAGSLNTEALPSTALPFPPSDTLADSHAALIDSLTFPLSLHDFLVSIERQLLLRALTAADNRTDAATLLGITPRQLRYRLQLLDIRVRKREDS